MTNLFESSDCNTVQYNTSDYNTWYASTSPSTIFRILCIARRLSLMISVEGLLVSRAAKMTYQSTHRNPFLAYWFLPSRYRQQRRINQLFVLHGNHAGLSYRIIIPFNNTCFCWNPFVTRTIESTQCHELENWHQSKITQQRRNICWGDRKQIAVVVTKMKDFPTLAQTTLSSVYW